MNLQYITSKVRSKTLFWILSGVLLIIMVAVHRDYGVTNDEGIHQAHGEVVLNYYKGVDSIAALSPIDSSGKLVETFYVTHDEHFRGMNFFGGFFDLTVNYLYSFFPNSNLYDFRHLINALFGFLMFVFIGLTTKELTNWKTAILALALASLTPRLFGHSFANPKDIPFATLYIIGIHQIIVFIKNLPKIKILNSLFLMVIFAISISIRVSGLLLIAYFLMSVFIYYVIDFIRTRRLKIGEIMVSGLISIGIALFGYWAVGFLWPYASTDFWAPIKILQKVSSFSVFNAYEVFGGKWFNAWEIPISYIPTWIWISSPVFINIGILLIGFVYIKKIGKDITPMLYSLLLFFALFPVLYIIALHSNVYNGVRHLLFVFPVLIVLIAIAWERMIVYLKSSVLYLISIVILCASMLQPLVWSVKNHPYEAMYFSPLVGGPLAVFGKYETDYWGISTKEAVEWIGNHTIEERKNKTIGIKMFYGDRLKVTNYIDSYKNLVFIPGNDDEGWDYEIIYTAAGKFNHRLITTWPPKNTVYQVVAGGVPLCAVVKNKYSGLSLEEIANQFPTDKNYINLSLNLYNKGDYINSIIAAKKAAALNKENTIALNNIGAAANMIGLYEIARKYLKMALEINPDFNLAKNNLAQAEKQISNKETSRSKLINKTLLSYQIGEYEFEVKYSLQLVRLFPQDAIAWNNLCSAYNATGEYAKAAQACLQSLKFNPDFQLAKNNLNYSRNMMK